MKKYRIAEIFYSIQGEGRFAGTPAVFVRFAGCNLACSWCDTDFEKRAELTAGEIVELVHVFKGAPLVVFTGGEPMLQLDMGLVAAVNKCMAPATLAIETNGTIQIPKTFRAAVWVTMSPKAGTPIAVEDADEIKVVHPTAVNPHVYDSYPTVRKYIMPLDDEHTGENVDKCVRFVKANPLWRLTLQMHKTLGIA